MGIDPVTATIGAAVLGAVVSGIQGQKQASAAKKAANAQSEQAKATADAAEQDMNRRNARGPNTEAMLAENELAAQSGDTGTMLTGPTGVDPSKLTLGKNTLIGL